jgi:hypothetical protein
VCQEAAQALSSIERSLSSQEGSLQDDVASNADERSEEGVAAVPLPAEENPMIHFDVIRWNDPVPEIIDHWHLVKKMANTIRKPGEIKHSDLLSS